MIRIFSRLMLLLLFGLKFTAAGSDFDFATRDDPHADFNKMPFVNIQINDVVNETAQQNARLYFGVLDVISYSFVKSIGFPHQIIKQSSSMEGVFRSGLVRVQLEIELEDAVSGEFSSMKMPWVVKVVNDAVYDAMGNGLMVGWDFLDEYQATIAPWKREISIEMMDGAKVRLWAMADEKRQREEGKRKKEELWAYSLQQAL